MSQSFRPDPYSSSSRYSRSHGLNAWALVRERGVYGMFVALAAMALGLSPVLFLLWWNLWRLTPVPIVPTGVRVQVKSGQHTRDAETDKPGETALLHVVCQVWRSGGWRDLLQFDDDAGRRPDDSLPPHVNRELVYLRPAKGDPWPFALLGEPPVSAWLPTGEYEVLVVYAAHRGFLNSDPNKPSPYPLATEHVVQDLPAGRRTVVHLPLPHHESCLDNNLTVRLHDAATGASGTPVPRTELEGLLAAIAKTTAIPTPGGVLLSVPEPAAHHDESHRGCELDLRDLSACRREWTVRQVQTLHDWLPPDATAARQRLEQIEQSLGWREFFHGWYWYAAAGISGLVFARWATIAKLMPYQARREFVESLKLLAGIFFLAVLGWIIVSALSDGPGLRVLPFR